MKLRPQAETLSGSPQPNFTAFQSSPILALRNPTSSDTGYPLGQLWINKSAGNTYALAKVAGGSATWNALGGDTTAVATLTGDSGTATPSSGNIQIKGTANQVSTSASGAIVTLALPSAITAPGSLTTTTTLTAGTDLASTAGNVLINGSAKQLRVKGGAVTDFIGQATLAAGTVTVANTNIAAGDRILVTRSAKNASTAYGTFETTISAGASFTITSCKSDTTTETNDVSTVDYFIVRQI